MKKLIYLFASLFIIISCENEKDIKSDIEKLRMQRTLLEDSINKLNSKIDNSNDSIIALSDDLKSLNILKSGKQPKYILKLKLKQEHYSLDLSTHMKDAMNAVELTIPVDKEYYDKVKVNTPILKEFRMGSLILKGSFGDWSVKVIDKYIIQ